MDAGTGAPGGRWRHDTRTPAEVDVRLSVIRAADRPLDAPLGVQSLDLRIAEHHGGWCSDWRQSPEAVVVVVLEGQLLVELLRDGATLGPGDVAILAPLAHHCLHALRPSVALHAGEPW